MKWFIGKRPSMENYLNSVKHQFDYYKSLGEKTIDQLSEDELFYQPDPESNSIAIIINHLWGNMMSRWADFLTTDGEKEWRHRDAEFEIENHDKILLLNRWNEGWCCLFEALDSITEENFDETVYIRNMGHAITEAINRQLCHYAYHVGQLVFLGKLQKSKDWKSMSIPKGKSISYNIEKFSKPKHKEHFTKEYTNLNK